MKQPTIRSPSLFVGLLSFAVAACSAGQDDLITVGVRPTDQVTASGGTAASGTGGLPQPGSDVMNPMLDGNSTTGVAASGASGATAAAPDAAIADVEDAAIGAADAGGSHAPNEDECGAIPSQPAAGVSSGRVSGPGLIEYAVDAPNVFIGLRTTLAVPAKPPPDGSIFIWPGIQPTPHGMNLEPIGNGALLSVLTWGPSCPPDAPESYSTWWIAPMYSNISSSDPQYAGCHSGKVALAEPKQRLDIEIHLDGTTWVQNIVNRDTMKGSDFSLDLNGQAQGRVFFDIELQTSNKPTEDIIFTNTVLSMNTADPDACQPVMRGTNDFASKPRVSSDGKHCCIDRIVLRAAGVMATTPDPL
jgi:hypothetical protein